MQNRNLLQEAEAAKAEHAAQQQAAQQHDEALPRVRSQEVSEDTHSKTGRTRREAVARHRVPRGHRPLG